MKLGSLIFPHVQDNLLVTTLGVMPCLVCDSALCSVPPSVFHIRLPSSIFCVFGCQHSGHPENFETITGRRSSKVLDLSNRRHPPCASDRLPPCHVLCGRRDGIGRESAYAVELRQAPRKWRISHRQKTFPKFPFADHYASPRRLCADASSRSLSADCHGGGSKSHFAQLVECFPTGGEQMAIRSHRSLELSISPFRSRYADVHFP